MDSQHHAYLSQSQSFAMQPGDDDQDQPAMQEAIADSLRNGDSNYIKNDQLDPPVHTCQNRVNIDDRINDMTMQAAKELPIVHDPKGDTWIFIDPPQRQPEQTEDDYERYIKRFKVPILMQKDTLTKYSHATKDSPGLAELFGSSQQYRILRRRKLVNKLPSNVKYVIDLTPPGEGEDFVFQFTELSCSEGIRLWYQSGQIWKVSRTMVKGEDEYSSMSLKAASNKSMPLEYSPVRHRSAIERVLSALQGMDPMLDSATKVWTTLAVAKTFNITHSPLEDWIIRWLRAYPNSYFLEVLPEVSHRIAEGLQNYDLARDSFAILVGEEALDSLRHARQPRLHKRTTFGRKKEELPEQIRTRIEYASKSFLERINDDFAYFVANRRMQWIDELPEARRLSSYMQPKIQDIVHKLKDLLKDYVRGAIYKTLCVDYRRVTGPDLHHEGGHDLLPRVDRAIVWANLPLSERILSRNFYEALKSLSMLKGATNLDLINGWHAKGGLDELSHSEKREMARGTYREVKKSDLRALVRNGQTLLDEAQQIPDAHPLPTRLHTLPDRTMDGAQNPKTPWNLLSTQPPDHNLYDAQRDSNIKCLPKRSHALPDRTINGAQDPANNNKASFSAPSQPVDVPKAPKRTQDFPDALSPPNDQQSATEVRTKWPFGAARDDPVAQVLKRVDGLHVSSLYLDRRPATDGAVEDPAGQGREHEGIARGTDPWRGYSDYLDYASETLKHLASKTNLFATNSATEKTPAPTEFSISKDFDDSDVFDEVWQQIEDSRRKESFSTPMFFDLGRFFDQAQEWIEGFASTKLRSSDHELGIVNTLVCLKDSEWKYLELWAGGNDDGSNGVYSDNVPTAEHGFTTAGPEVHDGLTPANSVKASSEFELVSAGDSASTFNASTATNRGFSDTIRRNHVHAVDSLNDSMSDSFTMVTPSIDSDDEETFARKQVAALERVEEAEEAAANEARRMVNGKGNIVEGDESYADLFSGEEEDDDGNDTDRAEFNDEDDNDNEDMVFC